MSRYTKLIDLVRDKHPRHVVEIGTWNGVRATQFMGITDCYYTGFDLFEECTREISKEEMNAKPPQEMVEVARMIQHRGFNRFKLIKGNTKETLPRWDPDPFDFAFIDGGHSVETIKHDFDFIWDHISPGGTIVLDDYYNPERVGFGCNFLVDHFKREGIDYEIHEGKDAVVGGGQVWLLIVEK